MILKMNQAAVAANPTRHLSPIGKFRDPELSLDVPSACCATLCYITSAANRISLKYTQHRSMISRSSSKIHGFSSHCSDSNSGSDSSSSSGRSEVEPAKQSTTNNTSKGSKSEAVKSDNSSPEGTDEDTRTGAITSNNNSASQYHNDNGTEESEQEEDSDAISNNSDNQQFSSSKSSIDVRSRPQFIRIDAFANFKSLLGGRRSSCKTESA